MRSKSMLLPLLAAFGDFIPASIARPWPSPFGAAYGRAEIRHYVACRKTVTAAALKRAAKKRRNIRARSPK